MSCHHSSCFRCGSQAQHSYRIGLLIHRQILSGDVGRTLGAPLNFNAPEQLVLLPKYLSTSNLGPQAYSPRARYHTATQPLRTVLIEFSFHET